MSPTTRQLSAPFNNPSANIQPLAQPMAQPMAQGQGPSFRFQNLNRAFQLDPRNTLASALMQQGMRGGPVRTPLEGIGRLSQSLVGAMLQKRALDRLEGQETTRQSNLQAQQDAITATLPANLQSMFTGPATAESLASVQQLNLQKELAPTSKFAIQQTPQGTVFGVEETDAFGNVTFKPSGQQQTPRPLAKKDQFRDLTQEEIELSLKPLEEGGKGLKQEDIVGAQVNTTTNKVVYKSKGGQTINVGSGESKFLEESGKIAAQELRDIRKDVFQDLELEARLDIASNLLEGGTETGPFTLRMLPIRGYLKQAGFLNDQQAQNLTNQEILNQSFSFLIPRMRVPGSGSTSDTEISLFSNATANFNNTPKANLVAVKGTQALVERKKEILKAMEIYADDKKSLNGVAEFIDETVPPAFKKYDTDDEYTEAIEKGELKKGDLYFNGKTGTFEIVDIQIN